MSLFKRIKNFIGNCDNKLTRAVRWASDKIDDMFEKVKLEDKEIFGYKLSSIFKNVLGFSVLVKVLYKINEFSLFKYAESNIK